MAGIKKIGLSAFFDVRSFTKNVRVFNTSIHKMNTGVVGVAKGTKKSLGLATRVVERFGLSWSRVADIITGVTIIAVFRKIAAALNNVMRTAIAAVSQFQKLEIQFQALAARDLAKEIGIPVAEALGMVTEEARELLMWVRKIAVTTPFSVETLARAVAYGQAFGFTVSQAKRLTLATGQFTAGMGLTNEVLERILWNFGQMLASGRVLGREIRDLANNFVPITDIITLLSERADVTFREMQDLMSEGVISAEEFIGAFVEIAETSFPGAMQRMSRTISGVTQNIKDFIETLFGMELLGPLFDELSGSAADFLDSLFNEKVLRAFTAMGTALLTGFKLIQAAFGDLVYVVKLFGSILGFTGPTALTFAAVILKISLAIEYLLYVLKQVTIKLSFFALKVQNAIGSTFSELAGEASSWGANIIISFAQGMAQALSYIISVMRQIAQVITGWLKGKSPPKLLPDLSWWGRSAMQIYLKGWAMADFSVFNKISKIFTSFIKSLSAKIPEEDIIPRILGAREGIAAAIKMIRETGIVSEKALRTIFKAAGITSKSIKKYIKALFQLEAVSIQVANAQKLLKFSLEDAIPTEIFGEMITSLTDLGRIAKKFGGEIGTSLQEYINRLYDLRTANLLVEQSQKFLNDVIKVYDDRLADLRKQQAALNDDLENANRVKRIDAAIATGLLTKEEKLRLGLERRGIMLRRSIRDTEEERKVAVDAAQEKVDAAKEAQEAAEAAADRQRTIALQIAETQLAAIKEQVDASKALIDIQTENNRLLSAQIALLERLAAAAAAAGADGEEGGLDLGGLFELEGADEDLLSLGEGITEAIALLEKDLREQMNALIQAILEPFSGLGKEIEEALKNVREMLDAFTTSPEVVNFGKSLDKNVKSFSKGWKKNWPIIVAIGLTAWTVIKEAFNEFVKSIRESLAEMFGATGFAAIDWEKVWTVIAGVVAVA
ncbi:hypothetical protein LCGC14_1122760, partial [marine sediment metagenome]